MQSFDVYFLGETLPDADPGAVRQGLARLFKIQEDAVDRLFSGKPLRVKQAVNADQASLYRAAFRDIGALIQIVPHGAPAPAEKTPPTPPPAAPVADLGGSPTASPVAEAAGSPDAAGGMGTASVAEPGAIIDSTPPPPPAQIDTSALEALPPNTGTLEDCKVEKPKRPIPDISHMKLVDD
jgi:hypothetical protein